MGEKQKNPDNCDIGWAKQRQNSVECWRRLNKLEMLNYSLTIQ